jgi:NADH:ubiquinone oxidoreductase subunit F (NADH-binding)
MGSEDNGIKQAFTSKSIKYESKKGNIYILPQNTKELKSLLKIIKDGVAKTYLLGRNVLGSDFEELS